MHKKNPLFIACLWGTLWTVLLLAGTLGCGGSGSVTPQENTATPSNNVLDDSISVEFSDGSFSTNVTPSVEKTSSPVITKNYGETAFFYEAGPPVDWSFNIRTTEIPTQDAIIRIKVPEEFLKSLDAKYTPWAFVKFYQTGADEEQIDNFEPMDGDFDSNTNTIIALLPKESFSDMRSEEAGHYESIIVIGSIPSSFAGLIHTDVSKMSVSKSLDETPYCPEKFFRPPLDKPLVETSSFKAEKHHGVDLKAANGDDVLAMEEGAVVARGYQFNPQKVNRVGGKGTGWGYYIAIQHTDIFGRKYQTLYAHLVEGSTNHLSIGQTVEKGDLIGKSDTSGGASGPHLHLEFSPNATILKTVKKGGWKVDPMPCIKYPVTIAGINVQEAVFNTIYGDLDLPPISSTSVS